MDVRTGPCVPLPGRKHSIKSVHSQDYGETPDQTAALFTVLTGKVSEAALEMLGVQVEHLRWWEARQSGDLIHFFGGAGGDLVRS